MSEFLPTLQGGKAYLINNILVQDQDSKYNSKGSTSYNKAKNNLLSKGSIINTNCGTFA